MAERDEHFDDPMLKGAVQRALVRESAPPALRARIVAALDAESGQASTAAPRVSRRRIFSYAAIAAVLLIGVSVSYITFFKRPPPAAAQDWFIEAMVTLHVDPAMANDPQLAPPNAGMDVIRETLAQRLKHPVMAAMPGQGWEFIGARVTEIRGTPAAQLMYQRGDRTLSVFSISAERMYMGTSPDGAKYELTSKGDQIAGFVYKGAVHCVVERATASPVTLAEAIQIRDHLRTASGLGQP